MHGEVEEGVLSWRRLTQPFDRHANPGQDKPWLSVFARGKPLPAMATLPMLAELVQSPWQVEAGAFDLRREDRAIEQAIANRQRQYHAFVDEHAPLVDWVITTLTDRQQEPLWRFTMAEQPAYLHEFLAHLANELSLPAPDQIFKRPAPALVEGSSQDQFDNLTPQALGHILYTRILVLVDMASRGMVSPGSGAFSRSVLEQWDGRLSHLGSEHVSARETGLHHARTTAREGLFTLDLDATPVPLALKGYVFHPSTLAAHLAGADLEHLAWNHAIALNTKREPANHHEWNRLRGKLYSDFQPTPVRAPRRMGP